MKSQITALIQFSPQHQEPIHSSMSLKVADDYCFKESL